MSLKRFKLGFGVAALLAGTGAAHATSLTLDKADSKTVGPQSESAPCIIAGKKCKNPEGFDFTDYKQGGNIDAFDEVSPTYTIDQFPFLSFDVAIDVNTNSAAGETLQSFTVSVDADGDGAGGFAEIYSFAPATAIGDTSNPGSNGFGDWLLGSIDLSSFEDDALVIFHAVWDGASAGPESFFLVDVSAPPPPPVSEPGTLVLMGLGLLGIGLLQRRRNSRR